ncbi:uncharacterized protein Nmag_2011 [Natrialba magadii ATCC 43099]|uniref:Uncharacterized protein n=1 Tax=Natrialba magadii (strain ATCC 43099 / DSM 3394 / CCM 3739 / CIP 104546 / IAM 13178 / JCM 8861 / NBRC 102185 / NCIMB 2190 / MS3) TaxID=547559 RepID=D3SVH3_NATMM|nr:uncharacterized protein Nmag_2011 [Natrialba magadii ATCC 43099]
MSKTHISIIGLHISIVGGLLMIDSHLSGVEPPTFSFFMIIIGLAITIGTLLPYLGYTTKK